MAAKKRRASKHGMGARDRTGKTPQAARTSPSSALLSHTTRGLSALRERLGAARDGTRDKGKQHDTTWSDALERLQADYERLLKTP